MITAWLQLFLMLVVILAAAEIFTNALEHAGEKMQISENATGSIFAAIATALPETLVPLLAIIAGTKDPHTNQEISVGAILGAPMMLSTLSTALMGIYALKRRGLHAYIKPELSGFYRDMNFFFLAYLVCVITLLAPHNPTWLRILFSVVMIFIYIFYLKTTLKASSKLVEIGHGVSSHGALYLTKFKLPHNVFTILLQIIFGLALLIIGAKGFIHELVNIANAFQLSPLLLSLFIVPIATELPEKVNSLIWLSHNKDTLAVGNITGAMVFQGTLLPALGVLLTPWQPTKVVLLSILITLAASIWTRMTANKRGIPAWLLIANGIFYAAYFYLAWFWLV